MTPQITDAGTLVQVALLPSSRPFTRDEALDRGITSSQLRELVTNGLVLHPMRGVFYRADAADCLELRIACLRLVVPRTASSPTGLPRGCGALTRLWLRTTT